MKYKNRVPKLIFPNFKDNREWKIMKLGEVVEINKYNLKENTDPNYQFTYIDLSAVNKGSINIPNKQISFKVAPSRARRIIAKDNIIISTVRPNLQGFAYIDFSCKNFIVSTGFAVLSYKSSIHMKYLYYILYSHTITRQIETIVTGSNYPAINSADIKNFIFILPPLSEQEKIAEILQTWDKAIEQTKELIAYKEKQKKGLMQQLLTGKKRLDGFNGEWKSVKLGEIGYTYGGLVNKTKHDFGNTGNKYISYLDIYQNYYITKPFENYVSIRDNEKQNTLQYGDILFTLSSETPEEVGISSVILFNTTEKIYLNSFSFCFRTNETNILYPLFSAYLFRADSFRFLIHKLAQGITRYNLSKTNFLNLSIKIPTSLAEQKAIADILSKADEEIKLLKEQLKLYIEQKKGLMQNLLTGKIRVK